ncbi:MAG: hypothetical protein ACJ8ER_01545 [Allosphingosinicella sp.]
MMRIIAMLAASSLAAACTAPAQPDNRVDAPAAAADSEAPAAAGNSATPAPAESAGPTAPGTPGGLAGDRTPVSEAPIADKSAQGAAQVVQAYYALIEAGKYGEAWRLWGGDGEASGKSESAFAAQFEPYTEYHAEVGAPGEMEGAAGSSYVEVPVQTYGKRKDGTPFRERSTVTLRRVNDVPGSTEAQRRWHINGIAPAAAGG